MFELARHYKETGMAAYSALQEKEFVSEKEHGYQAVKHQRFVGTGYFDQVQQVISGGLASTMALAGSTEAEQFSGVKPPIQPKHVHPTAAKSLRAARLFPSRLAPRRCCCRLGIKTSTSTLMRQSLVVWQPLRRRRLAALGGQTRQRWLHEHFSPAISRN